jgi:hypothetical protein
MKVLAPEARKSTASAISSGRPSRFIGTLSASRASSWLEASGWGARPASPGVSVGPGAMLFTRMPLPTSSAAQLRANERTAAFVEGRELAPAGVGEHDVESAAALTDGREDPVELVEARDVGADAGGVRPDRDDRRVDRFLAASGEEDVRALGRQPTGRRQADARGGARDQRGLAVELSHDRPSFLYRSVLNGNRSTAERISVPSG